MTGQQPYPQDQPYPGQPYPPPPGSPYQPYPPYAPYRKRPLGVTLLAILEILAGLFSLLASFGLFAIAALINVEEVRQQVSDQLPQWILDNAPVIFGVLGVVFLITAIVALVLAWGFLKGKRWARIVAIVLVVLGIINTVVQAILLGGTSVLTVGISIIIPVLIVIYLQMPNVKAWFTQ
jgi:hypothetical protein